MKPFDPAPFVRSLTSRPGVYRMLDDNDSTIYVGKAKNLKNRVKTYFTGAHSTKTSIMVSHIRRIEITVTQNETEALLLESNLIKKLKPRYNILFQDDKSYPYLYLSTEHKSPRLSFYRGARKGKGRYFGPYPSVGAARHAHNLIQRIFKIRQCDDSFFRNRSRACLQYQIKRCSAPCVGFIEDQDYAKDVKNTVMFLEGKNDQVIKALSQPMQTASDNKQYELAANYRDQIAGLRNFLASQYVTSIKGEADIIVCAIKGGMACIQVFYIRGGQNLGNKGFFQKIKMNEDEAIILATFIKQQYLADQSNRDYPDEIYVSQKPQDADLLEALLNEKGNKKIGIRDKVRGNKAKWVTMALENAGVALKQRLTQNHKYSDQLNDLREFLKLDEQIDRIECFDVSHISGELTVASCIVFGLEGPIKSDYRRFNIEGLQPGDDYAAMNQVISRRYTRVKKEEGKIPDLILIDGGKGQVNEAQSALRELQMDNLNLLGIAKGTSRKPGLETLVMSDGKSTQRLPASSPLLHLLQEIRDEAHRFAITGHRQRRKKKLGDSPLEHIDGIGKNRRSRLIHHFGGLQGIKRAGVEELANVPGINKNLAQKIYDTFHN